ncbi:hypothetical protein PMIN04_009289 [Paraphaeosphaeria minitans]|uniref:Cytochrome b561 domain-containing protein n=1 Tax=Paraphaeosphaeria minitans TaxID=565426 RepID=A0A9P6KJZ0_9PLEO|nr:hypothetical protein PMIN01_12985 [Paraphaeosphaeria minitans]
MIFSPSKAGWHLPFAFLTAAFILYILLGLVFTQWLANSQARPAHALDNFLSPETIDALYDDARLHDAILELTKTVAKISLSYGDRLESGGLENFGKSLSAEVVRIRAVEKPRRKKRQFSGSKQDGGGLFSGLASVFGGGDADDGNETGVGLLSGLSSLLGGNGNATSLGDLFNEGLSGITDGIVGGLATPAYFLGIGIGMGTENGLNFTTPEESKALATKTAAMIGEEATGFNLVAQNLGSGLSGQLAPSLSSLGGGDLDIGMMAFSLAQGIGQGTANGLNLTQQQFPPTNGSDIMTIVKNFGLGATGPIASNIDVHGLLSQSGSTIDIMSQLPQIAAAAGTGLGRGASAGLGLSKSGGNGTIAKRQAAIDPAQMDVPGIVGKFTEGLSQTFLQSSNLSMLMPGGGSGFNLEGSTVVSLASGAGKGIGGGIALGLGVTPGNSSTTLASRATGGGDLSVEQTTEQFTKNLMASLLQNGGIKAIGDTVTSKVGGLTSQWNIAQAAEGAARGLLEGSVSAISSAGGIQKVLKGDFPPELATNLPSLPQSQFNDSLNGSVVAFSRGLSGEGVLLISQLLKGKTNSSGAPPARRGIDASVVVPDRRLSRRADAVTLAVDGQTLEGIAQTGVDTITCSGLGGLAALALGITQGPALKGKMSISPSLDNSTLAALPKGPLTVMNQGNNFTIDLADQTVTINGMGLKPFATMTGLHIFLSTVAFFFALPTYLALGAIWRFSDMIGHPINPIKMKKWRMVVLFLFALFGFIGIILGIVGRGSAAHFQTAHSIFGLLALIFIAPAVALSFMRLRTHIPIPPPSAFLFTNQLAALKGAHKIHIIANMLIQQAMGFGMISGVQGFSDLRAISLCIVDAILTPPMLVGILNLVLFAQIGATGLLIARFILERRIALNGGGNVYVNEKAPKRSNTMQTFGFDSAPASNLTRPPLAERRTADLLGKEDPGIGRPFETRRLGSSRDLDVHPGDRLPSPNPFADPGRQQQRGFEGERRSLFPPFRPSQGASFNEDHRPSSDLLGGRFISYAPPEAEEQQDLGGGSPGPTLKRFECFSRPLSTTR